MGKAKRIKMSSGRQKGKQADAGMIAAYTAPRRKPIRGVTPGAEPTAVLCEVCGMMCDGYRVLEGRKEWDHGGRPGLPCVRRTGHIEPAPDVRGVRAGVPFPGGSFDR